MTANLHWRYIEANVQTLIGHSYFDRALPPRHQVPNPAVTSASGAQHDTFANRIDLLEREAQLLLDFLDDLPRTPGRPTAPAKAGLSPTSSDTSPALICPIV